MKPIVFTVNARVQMAERGAVEDDVIAAIRAGEPVPARQSRQGYRRNFQYERPWAARWYAVKQMLAIVAEEADQLVVVTVHTFYFWARSTLMRTTYDPQVDAMYIRFTEGPAQVTTVRLSDDIAINYAPDGNIVGIEVRDASAHAFRPGADPQVIVQNLTAAVV
ncbi:MAG: DUF2283 domain-containing protein [Dehalococcoidia bacterium]